MKQLILKGILVSLFIFTTSLQAQFYLSTSFDSYYDDNIFNNYLNTSDFVNAFNGELGYDFETEQNNFELYYSGFFNLYSKYSEKSTTLHKIGVVNTYLFAEYDNPLNIGFYYTTRINKDDYNIYDFSGISAYANYFHSISESDKIQFGVIGNRIYYKNFKLFSHYQLKAFVRSINSFAGKTSITTAVEIDGKLYTENSTTEGLTNEILQSKLFLQVGQGITDKLGVSTFGFFRKNITSGNRYFNSNDFVYYEEEIFNDIYSNEGIETGVTFSYLFLPNIMGRAAVRYQTRKYTDLPAVNKEGTELDVLRNDKQYSIGASLEIGLGEILSGLFLSLNYNYIRNSSNDYYYDYTNQVYAISLGFDF